MEDTRRAVEDLIQEAVEDTRRAVEDCTGSGRGGLNVREGEWSRGRKRGKVCFVAIVDEDVVLVWGLSVVLYVVLFRICRKGFVVPTVLLSRNETLSVQKNVWTVCVDGPLLPPARSYIEEHWNSY